MTLENPTTKVLFRCPHCDRSNAVYGASQPSEEYLAVDRTFQLSASRRMAVMPILAEPIKGTSTTCECGTVLTVQAKRAHPNAQLVELTVAIVTNTPRVATTGPLPPEDRPEDRPDDFQIGVDLPRGIPRAPQPLRGPFGKPVVVPEGEVRSGRFAGLSAPRKPNAHQHGEAIDRQMTEKETAVRDIARMCRTRRWASRAFPSHTVVDVPAADTIVQVSIPHDEASVLKMYKTIMDAVFKAGENRGAYNVKNEFKNLLDLT